MSRVDPQQPGPAEAVSPSSRQAKPRKEEKFEPQLGVVKEEDEESNALLMAKRSDSNYLSSRGATDFNVVDEILTELNGSLEKHVPREETAPAQEAPNEDIVEGYLAGNESEDFERASFC